MGKREIKRVKKFYTIKEIFGEDLLAEMYEKTNKRRVFLRNIRVEKNEIEIINLLLGKLIRKGKRIKMCQNLFKVLEILKNKASDDEKKSKGFLMECVNKIVPYIRLKSKRVGGVIYKLPIPLRIEQEYSKGLRWLVDSNKNKKMALVKSIVEDILLSRQDLGEVVKRKENDYKVAIANRPFVKFLK